MENLKFSPAFEHALNFILRPDIEGVYVNDPTDRGGETKYGISDRRDGVIDGKTDVNGDGKSDTGCAIPQSMQLEMKETASRNNGGALFREMAEWCDAQISKAVLGQTMTTDTGNRSADNIGGVYYKSAQIYINGSWRTVSG
ncbi:TPA: DUF935 family protein [Escherichia coli]|nr:DUF935 family protein [Escherichia coli]